MNGAAVVATKTSNLNERKMSTCIISSADGIPLFVSLPPPLLLVANDGRRRQVKHFEYEIVFSDPMQKVVLGRAH